MRAYVGIPLGGTPEIISVLERLHSIRGLRTEKSDKLHSTLLFFADIGTPRARQVCQALESLKEAKFTIRYSAITGFPSEAGARVIVVLIDSPELTRVYNDLSGKIGIKEERQFIPHLTLARTRGERVNIARILENTSLTSGGTEEVIQISLYESTLKPEGAEHVPVCTHQFI